MTTCATTCERALRNPGAAGQTKIALDFRRAIPDLDWHVDLILGDGDFVVGRWTATGTHTGPWGAIAPTGRPISFSGVNIFRFERGKVAEIWNHRDDLGLMTQLGAVTMNAGPTQLLADLVRADQVREARQVAR